MELKETKKAPKKNENNSSDFQCRACHSSADNKTFFSKNMRVPFWEEFQYILCSTCGSLSINNIPTDLARYYDGYYSFGPINEHKSQIRKNAQNIYTKRNPFLKWIFRSFLNTSNDLSFKSLNYSRIDKDSKILDVGCGTGQLPYDLVNLGFKNVLGVDPFLEKSIVYSNGCNVLKKSIFDVKGTWDLVMLHHVFEHMEFQQDILSYIGSLINTSGEILIRIPNIDSYAFRKFKENWYGIQAPVHLCLPSIKAMHSMVSNAGLRISEIQGENLVEFWYHSAAYSLNFWDFCDLGIRTHMKSKPLRKRPKIISKSDFKHFKSLNDVVSKVPNLCDWICYYITK